VTFSCHSKRGIFIQTEDKYGTVDNKQQLVSQTIKTLRISDSLPIAILTKVSNYNDDIRLKTLTGLEKGDGLQDYLLDSFYYDEFGNDTFRKSFVYLNNKWQPAQTFYKKFRDDKQVSYFMTERPFKEDYYSKRETFYSYSNDGKILTETDAECTVRNAGFSRCNCDSTFKKKYVYDAAGKLDSVICFSWKNNEWKELKKKNGG
jgi:hypothetical protein